jgi:hypothetical protein
MRWQPLLALLLLSCAASQQGMPAMRGPSSPAEGQAQMATLEQQIERDRAALGLPHRPPPAEPRDQRTVDLPSAPKPMAAPPPPPREDHMLAKARVEASASAGEPEPTCTGHGPCRYTRAICAAADRICAIAGFLGDADARQRCGRARQDCQDARQATRDRCPGC